MTASRHQEDLAAAFDEMADLLAIEGDNPFRVRAYRRAAQVVRGQPDDLFARIEAGFDPDELPGIGPDLAEKIRRFVATGRLPQLEAQRRKVPAGLRELLRIPGLGPKRVQALHAALQVRNLQDLRAAIDRGALRGVPGFGTKLQAQLRRHLATTADTERRTLRATAEGAAEALRAYLAAQAGVTRVEIAGSYRRGRETVGDLDVIVCGSPRLQMASLLSGYDDIVKVTSQGMTRASFVLRSGLAVDLRLVPPESAGAALQYFTGSKAHNLRLRRRAQQRGCKLNEYGLFRGARRIAGATEESIYAALGLPWIPPELREDRGEFEAAAAGRLPRLVTIADLRGDLHVHTAASDGTATLEQMAAAARERGLQYIAIADHARYLGIVRGLDANALARQIDAIDRFNSTSKDIVVLKSAEVDILPDGTLALPDAILSRLDLVVIAVHSAFTLPLRKQTDRLLRALDQRYVSILAHPSARLIGERAALAVEWSSVLARAKARPCYLEINAQPMRLDCDEQLARAAADAGVLLCISSDTHAPRDFDLLRHGVTQARRAWVTREHLLNTLPLAALRQRLAATMR
ncbi:MAG: DNA polymerase/3'-5' exonuclease PolX [Steroidobacteraceae bacterium]|nr:DNA polymerase/3'-5' exonuclease PolX [Steroidobacteraceae bacterium]MDW8259132.1 DNA polymerase/3'-5' exonuclease PolX [Gammaproteobacteria bacterium]